MIFFFLYIFGPTQARQEQATGHILPEDHRLSRSGVKLVKSNDFSYKWIEGKVVKKEVQVILKQSNFC